MNEMLNTGKYFRVFTSFLASSPFLILLGYLAMADAAFLKMED